MAMQLRSGRRHASAPVPVPRGDLRRVRPRRSDDDDDLISRLPKDMRLEVLARLPCTREAVRTSALSSPWRRLWTELRSLTFDDDDDGVADLDLDSLLGALAQAQPKLNRLCIKLDSEPLAGASMSSLFRAADKLELVVEARLRKYKHRSAPCFVLPCFARATSFELCISGLRCRLPRTGSFASLEQLALSGDGCFVDPGVLLPRCPRLRKLTMMDSICPQGVQALTVESSSLRELDWHLMDIEQPAVDVHVVAPNLERFLFSSWSRKFTIVSLSAPKLEDLWLEYCSEDSMVGYLKNVRWRLCELRVEMGLPGMWTERSDDDGRQHVLSLCAENVCWDLPPDGWSFEQEVARLPGTLTDFSALELHLRTEGHVFGALALQLLRIKTDIQRLTVALLRVVDFKDAKCWHHCDCDFASEWRDEPISLPRLEVAEFVGFHGHDHEMDFLKLLYGSAPSLKKMSVQHYNEASIVKGACQKLHNIFSANASVSFSFS